MKARTVLVILEAESDATLKEIENWFKVGNAACGKSETFIKVRQCKAQVAQPTKGKVKK